jgi:hypothetical protein
LQAAHEDEDETIKDGEKIALGILREKGHLYNKILQLVMADGAYIEGRCNVNPSLHFIQGDTSKLHRGVTLIIN